MLVAGLPILHAWTTTGTLTPRVLRDSVSQDVMEVRFEWRIESFRDVDIANAQREIRSPKARNADLGLEGDKEWQISLYSNNSDWGVLQVWLSSARPGYEDYEDSDDEEEDEDRVEGCWKAQFYKATFVEAVNSTYLAMARPRELLNFDEIDYEQPALHAPQALEVELVVFFPKASQAKLTPVSKPNSKLTEGCRNFLHSDNFTDFTLVSSEEKEIRVHQLVMASASEVFRAMLTLDTKERRTGRCEITDVNYKTLKAMVDRVYGVDVGEMDVEMQEALFLAADKYHLVDVRTECAQAMCGSLTLQNVVDRFLFAKHHTLTDLSGRAVEFCHSNYDKIAASTGFFEMCKRAPALFDEFIGKFVTKKRTADEAGSSTETQPMKR